MAGYVPGQNAPAATDSFVGTGDNIGTSGGEDSFLNLTTKEAKLTFPKLRAKPVPPNLSPAQYLLLDQQNPDSPYVGQRTTAGDALQEFYQMGGDQLAGLQSALVQVPGLFSSAQLKNLRLGVPDEASYAAYHKIVRRAVLADKTIEEVLTEAGVTAGGGVAGGGGSSRAPLTITLTNPADIELLSKKVGQDTIGRWLSTQEEQAAVKGYQGQEAAAQRAVYNTGASGGTSTQAPSAQAFIEQQARAQHPLEAQGHDVANTMDTFLQLLGGK